MGKSFAVLVTNKANIANIYIRYYKSLIKINVGKAPVDSTIYAIFPMGRTVISDVRDWDDVLYYNYSNVLDNKLISVFNILNDEHINWGT